MANLLQSLLRDFSNDMLKLVKIISFYKAYGKALKAKYILYLLI